MSNFNLDALERFLKVESTEELPVGKLPMLSTPLPEAEISTQAVPVGWAPEANIYASGQPSTEIQSPQTINDQRPARSRRDKQVNGVFDRRRVVKAAVDAAITRANDRIECEKSALAESKVQTPSFIPDKGPQYGRGDVPSIAELKVLGSNFEYDPKQHPVL